MMNTEKKGADRRLVPSKPFKRFRHLLRLIGFTLGLLILLALFHLLTMGLPDHVTQKITAQARKKGLPLQIGSIQLSPHRGWVLHDVRLYSTSPDDLKPVFSAKKLYVFLWPDSWIAPSKAGWNMSLSGKSSEVSLGTPWETALSATSPFRKLDRLRASLHIDSKQLQLETSEFQWGGIHIHTSGQIDFTGPPVANPLNKGFWLRDHLQAAQLANVLERLSFETAPDVTIRFDIHPKEPKKNSVEAACLAEGILWGNRTCDRLSGQLNHRNHQLTLDSLQLTQLNGGQLTASGSFDLETRVAQLHLQNDLPLDDLLHLLPAHIDTDLARMELQPLGPVEFDATLGPAPLDQLLEQIQAEVHNLPVTRNDLTLDPLKFTLLRNGNQLTVKGIQAGANQGTLSGTCGINLSSKAWDASLHAVVQPDPFGTLVGPGLQMWIDRATFTNQPPDIHIDLSYGGTSGTLKMDGTFSAQNLSCTGGPLDTLQLDMAYSNRHLSLAPIHAAYQDRQFDGSVHIDFAKSLAHFNITTNQFQPQTLAQILAPDHPSPLDKFTFSGPITSSAEGQIDYGTWTHHIVQGTLRAEQVSAGKIQVDVFDSRVNCLGTQLQFTDTSMQLYDGIIKASSEFDLFLRDGTAPYRINIDATHLDLNQMLEETTAADSKNVDGLFSGTLDVTADAEVGFWDSAKGYGQVDIEKGRLASIPLLGGFSLLMPGIKLFSITTFFADYELRDGKLLSQNILLGGTLLSAQARGSYSPKTGLNIKLRAAPLRNTRENKKWYQLHLWSAEALKKTTAPLFDLLEFKLEGTLENPQWRMKALPKEIYDIIRPKDPEAPVQP